jgi:hypothetical protein
MTTQDRDKLLTALRESREAWLASLQGATNINQRPEASRWSVLEVAEHVAIVENRLAGAIKDAPLGDPPMPIDEARDHGFLVDMSNREERFQAPEVVQPTGKMQTLEEAMASFEIARASLIEHVESCADLRERTTTHRKFGRVSAYEMSLIGAAHTNRHAKQVAEVRTAITLL